VASIEGINKGRDNKVKTIETTVYQFKELSDEAKEKAREWYRDGALDYEWWDFTYLDAADIGLKITEFDLDRNRHAKGNFTESAEDVAKAIKENHGPDCETYKTAQAYLVELAAVKTEAEKDEDYNTGDDLDTDDIDREFLHSLLEDYSIMLQHEYEYLLSDESVDETIMANEYTFTEEGKREG
jgi:hypothetical protein